MRAKNYRLLVAYDGSPYFGWQKVNVGPSIEEVLQKALRRLLQEDLELQAASRTDRGVHAMGQVVQFRSQSPFPVGKMRFALNELLPADIRVLHAEEAHPDFHPTVDAKGKIYHYHVSFGPIQLPKERWTHWHLPYQVDFDLMRQGAQALIGVHDFLSFCNVRKNHTYESSVRHLKRVEIRPSSMTSFYIEMEADRFLFRMARNIAGLLSVVGRGLLPVKLIPGVIAAKDRRAAPLTAPAKGLTLYQVLY
ncbi:MAG: truA2 [Chlamydiales bacterium]|jgi:tRNA pseudouridine38-40 synthase|nr:truA2 [Chlamydiales bacterium]